MKTADIITLGCSKNLVDSEQLMRQFGALGYAVRHDAPNPDGDVVVINTCGFIEAAKQESIEMILQLAEKRKKGKIGKLFVMGCLSERYTKELQAEIPEVDKFFGKFNYTDILKEIGEKYRADLKNERTLSTPAHYAYVKISEGCNRTCSYCAIPIITGRHRSRKIEDITEEVKSLVQQGVKEFNLIAQDLSSYGSDRYKALKLAELTEQISDISGVEWIRLHYAYPAQFPADILRVMRERENVCKYLDLALQHISDKMLQLMRRNITAQQTYELIEKIRNEVPDIHIRTTFLLGHPQENEEDIEELKNFIKFAKFERMGAFTYSHEEGTFAAENYSDNINEAIKQRRLDEIMDIQQQISLQNNRKKIGQNLKIIIDRRDGDYYIGRTEFDSPEVDGEVLLPTNTKGVKIGEFYNAEIIDAEEFDLYAK
ncbi:MAG: 30S ribosomal protein S12 methylthiotransferase RimO [Paludibacter sp.]|jgi:ribosomal protein S12 methylthiotransferase|nr:30S ribosomal protein S12 methylthiotransferase RimO [Paludibacter sp.]